MIFILGKPGKAFGPTEAGEIPITPTLAVSVSGTTATATVTATAGITVNLYRKATTDSVWVLAGTRTGSGTIVVSGLTEGMQYVFIAIAIDGGLYSFPSISVVISLPVSTSGSPQGFRDDGLVFLLKSDGENVVFYPDTGGSRSIRALVDRLGPQDVPGAPEGVTEIFRMTILNSSLSGISTAEINVGKSKIGVARRPGLANQERIICSIENQDRTALQIMVA